MCGRAACTLHSSDICRGCTYNSNGINKQPDWRGGTNWPTYYPCYNVGPTKCLPVLLYDVQCENKERILQPMVWGFNLTSTSQPSIINARGETLLEKPTFKSLLQKGQRCVVIAEGYFEWKRDSKTKQPYYIYRVQINNIPVYDEEWKRQFAAENWDVTEDLLRPKLLTMAGLFQKQSNDVYNFIVITVNASSVVSDLHDRMPAILETDEAVEMWLDSKNIPANKAVKLLKPSVDVSFHPVSSIVGNVKNDSIECIQLLEEKKTASTSSSNFMKNWLQKGKKESTESPESKKAKLSQQ